MQNEPEYLKGSILISDENEPKDYMVGSIELDAPVKYNSAMDAKTGIVKDYPSNYSGDEIKLAMDIESGRRPDETYWEQADFSFKDKVMQKLKGLYQVSPEKASNIIAISEYTGIPAYKVEEEYDELTKELGLRSDPTTEEMFNKIIIPSTAVLGLGLPVAAPAAAAFEVGALPELGLLEKAVKIAPGIGKFMLAKEAGERILLPATKAVCQMLSNEPLRYEKTTIEDLMPEGFKDVAPIADFVIYGAAAHSLKFSKAFKKLPLKVQGKLNTARANVLEKFGVKQSKELVPLTFEQLKELSQNESVPIGKYMSEQMKREQIIIRQASESRVTPETVAEKPAPIQMKEAIKDIIITERMPEIASDMIARNITPAKVVAEFFDSSFENLPVETQLEVIQKVEDLTGIDIQDELILSEDFQSTYQSMKTEGAISEVIKASGDSIEALDADPAETIAWMSEINNVAKKLGIAPDIVESVGQIDIPEAEISPREQIIKQSEDLIKQGEATEKAKIQAAEKLASTTIDPVKNRRKFIERFNATETEKNIREVNDSVRRAINVRTEEFKGPKKAKKKELKRSGAILGTQLEKKTKALTSNIPGIAKRGIAWGQTPNVIAGKFEDFSEGALSKTFVKDIDAGTTKKIGHIKSVNEIIKTELFDLIDTFKDMSPLLNENFDYDDVDYSISTEFGDIPLTDAELISIELHSRNAENLKSIMQGGFRLREEDIALKTGVTGSSKVKHRRQKGDISKNIKLTPKQLADIKDYVMTYRADDLGRIADTFSWVLNNPQKNALNATSQALEGYDIAPVENYWQKSIIGEQQAIGEIKEPTKAFAERLSILKARENSGEGIILQDAFEGFLSNVELASEYIGMAGPLRQARAVLNDKTFKEQFINGEMQHYYESLNNNIEVQEKTAARMNDIDKLIGNFVTKTQGYVLGNNPFVTAIQAASLFPADVYVDTKKIPARMKVDIFSTMSQTKFNEKYAVELDELNQIPQIWYRMQGRAGREMTDIAEVGNVLQFFTGEKTKQARTMQGISNRDSRVMVGIWTAAKAQSKGDINAAVDLMLETVNKTQPPSFAKDRTPLNNSNNPALRAVTFATSQRFQYVNMLAEQFARKRTAEATGNTKAAKEAGKNLSKAMWTILVLIGLYQAGREEVRDIVFNRERDGAFIPRMAKRMLKANVNLLPIVGGALDLVIDKAQGKRTFKTQSTALKTYDDVSATVDELMKASGDLFQGKDWEINAIKGINGIIDLAELKSGKSNTRFLRSIGSKHLMDAIKDK